MAEDFLHLTTFQYASNEPVGNIDLDGLEGIPGEHIDRKEKEPKDFVSSTGEAASKIAKPLIDAVEYIDNKADFAKVELEFSFGARAGITVGPLKLDLNLGSISVAQFSYEQTGSDKGPVTKKTKAIFDQKTDFIQVKQGASATVLGVGPSAEKSFEISNDSEYTYRKGSATSKTSFGPSRDDSGVGSSVNISQENSSTEKRTGLNFEFGFQSIIGVNLSFQIGNATKIEEK